MGVNKDTKIFYKHGDADAFAAVGGQSTTGSITLNNLTPNHDDGTALGVQTGSWKEADSFTYRNEANDADVVKSNWGDVMKDLTDKHHGGTKNSYAEGVAPMQTWASVAEAKKCIFGPDILAGFDTHCDTQEWALVDGDKGLKHTRDWKIENNASADGHYAQFKAAHDSKHDVEAANNPYFQSGAFFTNDSSHLF